ncbi:hypothetical protein BEP19_14080 [Ammoniphilus oxalaticus]|uniref:Uncharacterized protein n=2 Tax=Ammoniphilus oxalaticus TaxID=66863 RepID=A0A419SEW6_9BACL|nr:hypothetical protein BEP19_14080 [Ammoniphilus oxalaticus]
MTTQNPMHNQQPLIMTPPAVVTTKDSMYLKDGMSWLLLAAKKCAHYANEAECSQVQQMLNQMGQLHLKHYKLLLRHCQNNNTQQMAQVPHIPQQ